jgi:hypothetical protein
MICRRPGAAGGEMKRNLIEVIALVSIVIGMGGLMYSNIKLSNQVKEAEAHSLNAEFMLKDCQETRTFTAQGFLNLQKTCYKNLDDCEYELFPIQDELAGCREATGDLVNGFVREREGWSRELGDALKKLEKAEMELKP